MWWCDRLDRDGFVSGSGSASTKTCCSGVQWISVGSWSSIFFSQSGVPMEIHGTPEPISTPPPGHHTCPRCGGLLLAQHYIDLLDDTGQIDITAWHCTMCGEVLDPVILKNRRSPPPNLLYGTKARKFSQRVTDMLDESESSVSPDGTETSQEESIEDSDDERAG